MIITDHGLILIATYNIPGFGWVYFYDDVVYDRRWACRSTN